MDCANGCGTPPTTGTASMKYEASALFGGRYAVQPVGTLGTCGWVEGVPWEVQFIRANTSAEALRIAEQQRKRRQQS